MAFWAPCEKGAFLFVNRHTIIQKCGMGAYIRCFTVAAECYRRSDAVEYNTVLVWTELGACLQLVAHSLLSAIHSIQSYEKQESARRDCLKAVYHSHSTWHIQTLTSPCNYPPMQPQIMQLPLPCNNAAAGAAHAPPQQQQRVAQPGCGLGLECGAVCKQTDWSSGATHRQDGGKGVRREE